MLSRNPKTSKEICEYHSCTCIVICEPQANPFNSFAVRAQAAQELLQKLQMKAKKIEGLSAEEPAVKEGQAACGTPTNC